METENTTPAALRSLRTLRAVGFRNLSPCDHIVPLHAELRATAGTSAPPLHVTHTVAATLNPHWDVDLDDGASHLRSVTVVLRRSPPATISDPSTPPLPNRSAVGELLLEIDVELCSLVHVAGGLHALSMVPPNTFVFIFEDGVYTHRRALEPMRARGLVACVRRGDGTSEALGAFETPGAPVAHAGSCCTESSSAALGPSDEANGSEPGEGTMLRELEARLEQWATETLDLVRASEEVEASNKAAYARLDRLVARRSASDERRRRVASLGAEVSALRRQLEHERSELQVARTNVGVATQEASVASEALASTREKVQRLRVACEEGMPASAVGDEESSLQASISMARQGLLRSLTLIFPMGVGQMDASSNSPAQPSQRALTPPSTAAPVPTLCSMRAARNETNGGTAVSDEETNAALGYAAQLLAAVSRLGGESLNCTLNLKGSRSGVTENASGGSSRTYPLHGRGAEAAPAARLLLAAATRLVGELRGTWLLEGHSGGEEWERASAAVQLVGLLATFLGQLSSSSSRGEGTHTNPLRAASPTMAPVALPAATLHSTMNFSMESSPTPKPVLGSPVELPCKPQANGARAAVAACYTSAAPVHLAPD